tara:strand:+ start:2520 stop:4166 length:1647 start_codon:yes stop_codon:yes gene_type:complete
MAATELLDYNQIQEQTAATGDAIAPGGGPMIWQFRADPNLAWDPSQTFFAMDVELSSVVSEGTADAIGAPKTDKGYIPDTHDIRPFFPLRCFNSMSHTIDGVTVATTQRPYMDKLVQERYLHESTQSNLSNFESLQLCRSIDSGNIEDNIFCVSNNDPQSGYMVIDETQGTTNNRRGNAILNQSRLGKDESGKDNKQTVTVLFQPPFDFWTKHQRCSGGNHQITLNLKASTTRTFKARVGATSTACATESTNIGWASYIETPCVGRMTFARKGVVGCAASGSETLGNVIGLKADIKKIRLMRRMVRFTIERPIATQEFNLTEYQLYIGQNLKQNGPMSQNFLLPSSTFGLIFFWKDSGSTEHDNIHDFPRLGLDVGSRSGTDTIDKDGEPVDYTPDFTVDEFYFTYGGETYPAQRIGKITAKNEEGAFGFHKLQTISNQLMGTYNMPQEYINSSASKGSLMTRLDGHQFFFPVAKHANSDNSDLQVTYSAEFTNKTNEEDFPGSGGIPEGKFSDRGVNLCVVALYDARIELSYNAANQLEKVTKTEWK